MAVGRKGTFAGVSQAPVVDFAEMMRNAQREESRFQNKRLALAGKYNEQIKELEETAGLQVGSNGEYKSILESDPKAGNFAHSDVLIGGILKEAQELDAKFAKELEGQTFSDGKSIGELRGKRNALNRAMGKLNQDLQVLQSADKKLSEIPISKGVEGGLYNTLSYLSSGKKVIGYGFDEDTYDSYVEVEEGGEKKKISISNTAQWVENAPVDLLIDDNVSKLADEFIAPIEDKINGFTTTQIQGLVDSHKEEVRDWVEKQVLEPRKLNSAVYEAFNEKGVHNIGKLKSMLGKTVAFALENKNEELLPEKLRGIEPKDITDGLAYEVLADELSNKMFRNIQNRVTKKTGKTIDYGAQQDAIEFNADQQEEEIKETSYSVTTEPELRFYDNVFKDETTGSDTLDEMVEGNKVRIGKDEVIREYNFSNPLNISRVTGYINGQPKSLNDVSTNSIIETKDGLIALNVSFEKKKEKTEGESIRATEDRKGESERIKVSAKGAEQTSILLTKEQSKIFKQNYLGQSEEEEDTTASLY